MRILINGKKYPILWLILLGFNVADIPREFQHHSWTWFAADIAAGLFCAYRVNKEWPKEEPPKNDDDNGDKTQDVRTIWKDKFKR